MKTNNRSSGHFKNSIMRSPKLFIPLLIGVFLIFAAPLPAADYKIVSAELPPWSITSERGIFTEIVSEIEKRTGTAHIPSLMSWSRAQKITQKTGNHLIYPLMRTPNREDKYQWIIEVMPSNLIFASIGGEPIDIEAARKLKKILVQENAPPHTVLKGKGFTNLHPLAFGAGTTPKMLEHNRGDAWFSAENIVRYTIRSSTSKDKYVFGPPIVSGMMYIACSREFPNGTIDAYRKAFEEIKADGTYDKILKKYIW